ACRSAGGSRRGADGRADRGNGAPGAWGGAGRVGQTRRGRRGLRRGQETGGQRPGRGDDAAVVGVWLRGVGASTEAGAGGVREGAGAVAGSHRGAVRQGPGADGVEARGGGGADV